MGHWHYEMKSLQNHRDEFFCDPVVESGSSIKAMFEKYSTMIDGLDVKAQSIFYNRFSLNLTIAVRYVVHDESIDDRVKLDLISKINEVAHQTANRQGNLISNLSIMSNSDFVEILEYLVQNDRALESVVRHSLEDTMYSMGTII